LTKAQLADLLFEQIGLNKRESKDMIDAFFDLIAQSLVNGVDVKISGFGNFQIRTKAPRPGRNPRTGEAIPIEAISGFGNFQIRTKAPRPGRNPRTGEAIPIEARRAVTFHASHKLKEQLQA